LNRQETRKYYFEVPPDLLIKTFKKEGRDREAAAIDDGGWQELGNIGQSTVHIIQ
jgi:hypothetical protein